MRADRSRIAVESVSDRHRNPFGMRPACPDGPAVPGYGDPSGDFHLIGDHPGRHGGSGTGVPFTETRTGEHIQQVLHDVGLLADPYADEPVVTNLFCNYLHMCTPAAGTDPSARSYARLERFFDAEVRAVNAHILLPVGRRATDQVLTTYSTQSRKVPDSMDERHAMEVRGRGFLVIPIKDPADWQPSEGDAIRSRLQAILDSDYRQTKGVATRIG